MITIFCHSNLDLNHCESWPNGLQSVPRVGDLITSGFKYPNHFRLQLEVVSVNWKQQYNNSEYWHPYIKLHIPLHMEMSINDFQEFYRKARGE